MDPCILTGFREKDEQDTSEEGHGEEFVPEADDYQDLSLYPPINLKAIFEG